MCGPALASPWTTSGIHPRRVSHSLAMPAFQWWWHLSCSSVSCICCDLLVSARGWSNSESAFWRGDFVTGMCTPIRRPVMPTGVSFCDVNSHWGSLSRSINLWRKQNGHTWILSPPVYLLWRGMNLHSLLHSQQCLRCCQVCFFCTCPNWPMTLRVMEKLINI